jgi:hypothetical protein
VIARLIALPPVEGGLAPAAATIDAAVRELDGLAADARKARGSRRDAIVERLAHLDRDLVDKSVGSLDSVATANLYREAEAELAAFLARMPADTRASAIESAFRRLVRESVGLPTIAFE